VHVRVNDRGGRALGVARDAADLGREEDGDGTQVVARVAPIDQLLDPPLACGVGRRVREADDEDARPLLQQAADDPVHLLGIGRLRDRGHHRRRDEVEDASASRRPVQLLRDARAHDQAELGPRARDDRVRRDRRGEADDVRAAQKLSAGQAERPRGCVDRVREADGEVVRGRLDLDRGHLLLARAHERVGEGAAGVDPHRVRHRDPIPPSASARRDRSSARSRSRRRSRRRRGG